MKRVLVSSIKSLLKSLLIGVASVVATLVVLFIVHLNGRPDLKVWHEAELDEEFTADGDARTFDEYLALEKRLFEQLEKKVYARVQPEDQSNINRYHKGSLSSPGRWATNWNRSFEFPADHPRAGVLLLHGMSDSPYSLRNMGERLNAEDVWVVGLRLPGHGTAPSGLVNARWEDMAAAVRLAVRHLRDKTSDRPLYIVGYSNGGALAVHHALLTLEDDALPKVNGLVLISPSIGVSPLAALAVWQARLGGLLGLDKLVWNSIQPEYDPFKYQSFAVNAGDQVHRLTTTIRRRMKKLAAGVERGFPPVLAFQSVVDATVSTRAVVDRLFARVPAGGKHELVLFDVNRRSGAKQALIKYSGADVEAMFGKTDLSFTISLVTNARENDPRVMVRGKEPGKKKIVSTPLELSWPDGLYSLSHVALPFPPDDPLYGGPNARKSPGVHIGNTALRGERGLLRIPARDMLRLRWNPFYPYMERRIMVFLGLNSPGRRAESVTREPK
ncbi:MAG: alpha/beta hydrolase [Desulfobacterales bacterium]|nr:alpha/beta hydrolase [Desulfobacterales bacterium]